MNELPGPHDRPAVSVEDRAWMESDARLRKTIYAPPFPSRSRFGRILGAIESLFGSSRPQGWG